MEVGAKYDSDVFTLFQVKPSHVRRCSCAFSDGFMIPVRMSSRSCRLRCGSTTKSLSSMAVMLPSVCILRLAFNHLLFPGLCRSGVATIEQLKAIDRRRPVPVSTADPADILFFDTMWAGDASLHDQSPVVHTLPNFLSSTDPQPNDGFGTSVARGSGCVTFGPDVTRRFCEINRLRMIVRSHEVPKTMTGVQARASHHLGNVLHYVWTHVPLNRTRCSTTGG